MRVVSCPTCSKQYNVTDFEGHRFGCSCGDIILIGEVHSVEVPVTRCASCGALLEGDEDHCGHCRAEVDRSQKGLSLICPGCYARNPEHSSFCRGCGLKFNAQPVREWKANLPCPSCAEVAMRCQSLAGFDIRHCPSCDGLWIATEDLDAIAQRVLSQHQPATKAPAPSLPSSTGPNPSFRYRRCPIDGGIMARRNYQKISGIILDSCPEHGVFLDADELEAIVNFLAQGGLQRTEAWQAQENARQAMHKSSTSSLPSGSVIYTSTGAVTGMNTVGSLAALFGRVLGRLFD